jgi:hypothetical protein
MGHMLFSIWNMGIKTAKQKFNILVQAMSVIDFWVLESAGMYHNVCEAHTLFEAAF